MTKKHYTQTAWWKKRRQTMPGPMMTVQVRLTPGMIAAISEKVKTGLYHSKSDFVRDCVRSMLGEKR